MAPREFYYLWEVDLESSPERLWPYVADTNRFNRDTDLPTLKIPPQVTRLPNGRRLLRFYRLGVQVDWHEEPFEWVRPYRFGVQRRYISGPVAQMRTLTRLDPTPQGGTHLTYEVWASPKGPLGLLAIPIQIGLLSSRAFMRAFRSYDRLAATGEKAEALLNQGKISLVPGGRERLAAIRREMLRQSTDAALVNRLVDFISQADDLTASRIRPYALADAWGIARRSVLELCLWATRAGLLEFRWEILCPLCRGSKQQTPTLGGLRSQMHCATCNIDFTANFDRSVELTFRPASSIREYERHDYCLGGPQLTPHIMAQQMVPPGESRVVQLGLEQGRHRVRALELPGGRYLAIEAGGAAQASIRAEVGGWPDDELALGPQAALNLENATAADQLLIVERLAWSDQAATAAEVTALQPFRDLFASEALRPGEQISVGTMTIVFTDLRESTRMYREIGDAVAFGLVMSHFDILKRAIDVENGAVVKTIGDAVMAVFRRPAEALRAMLAAQHTLISPPAGGRPFEMRVGIHTGPCVAVNLNDRLDYFGSTVNLSARLEALSTGGEVVISAAVKNDPEVTDLLATRQADLIVEPVDATLKGFEDQHFELYLVAPRAVPVPQRA